MRKAVGLVLIALLGCLMTFAQSTGASFGVNAQVTVGRGASVASGVHVGPDPVELTWRHCQKYTSTHHKFLWFGKVQHTDAAGCAADESTVFNREITHNLVTNAGFDLISSAVSNTATQAAACNYIAVTNTAITPAAGDTTLSGEIAANGLTRAQGTYSHTNGTQTYTVSKVFTASGTQASQATGLFNASSSGTMCYEATYTQVTVNSGDTLTVTWTVTLS